MLSVLERGVGRVPDAVWGPTLAAGLLLGVGLVGLGVGQPWLFPSLGPTASVYAQLPGHPSARLYNTVVGHLIALGAGFLAVAVLGASDAPAVLSTGNLAAVRVWAAVLAVALTLAGEYLLRASHPPAAATTLLVALGSLRLVPRDVIAVVAGILIIAAIGEPLRWLRMRATKSDSS